MEAEIIVVADVTSAALDLVTSTMLAAVHARGRAVLCLSGGSTPVPLYARLAQRQDLPWADTVLVWGDERYVKHDHPDSNYGAARRVLVDHVGVTPSNVLPWPEGPTPDEAAAEYGRTLVARLGDSRTFDVNVMGLGPDGHTASLFPFTGAAVRPEDTFALEAPGFGWRLTMGASRLSDSRLTLFVVSGEEKRRALQDTFGPSALGRSARSPAALDRFPGRAIGARDRLVLVTDVDLG